MKQEAAAKENPSGIINPPLTFALKGIDPAHRFIERLGIREETATQFGAGVFTGKGMFKNHFVIPILNPEGKLIAYNGVPIEGNPNPMYPPKFVKESALFNLNTVAVDDCQDDTGLILVRDPLQVLVLAAAGFPRAVAWMSDTLTREQLRQLLLAYGAGKRITLICASDDKEIVSNLAQVLPLFFVRLIRYERKVAEPAGFAVNELNELLSLP